MAFVSIPTLLLVATWTIGTARINGPADGASRRLVGRRSTEEIMAELDALVGLTEVKAQMRELVAQVEFQKERKSMGLPDIGEQSLHMSFLGNPGTGKTVVARIVGELMVSMGAIESTRTGSLVTEVSRADLVGQHLGDTAIQVTEVFQRAKGGVLFLDEAYALVNPNGEDMFGHEAVDTLIKLMEDHRDKVVVILAGYHAEMVEFIAANPGFKSRVAFEFSFRDYTCPELVEIGESLMASKSVALVQGKSRGVCNSTEAEEVCAWMLASIRFRTGCCDTEDCGKEENRANGNGRTVRNLLEASYREMGSRVLTTYPPVLLLAYDRTVKPQVNRDGVPVPELDCTSFQEIRSKGPFMNLSDTNDADLRCAFRLLEAGDLRRATGLALAEQLQANCQRTRTPVSVNISDLLAQPDAHARIQWDVLHDLIYGEQACSKAQALLNGDTTVARFLLEGGDWGWGKAASCDVAVQCKVCREVAGKREELQKRQKSGFSFASYDDLCNSVISKVRLERAWRAEGAGCREYCYSVMDHTLALLDSHESFDCSYVVGERCPEDLRPADGTKPWNKDPNDFSDATFDENGRPILRPGSKVDELMKELDELVGLETVKAGLTALRDAVEFDMWRKRFLGSKASLLGQSFHMRFLGNPGTGKTVVARLVGQILAQLGVIENAKTDKDSFVFKEVSRSDLIAQYSGQTAPKVIKVVQSAFGGVLFIDEAYSIVLGKDDPFGKEAVDTLIKEIEDNRDKLVVIFAGYQKEMDKFFETNPGFQSRVPFRFEFADYSCQELVSISEYGSRKNDVTPTARALRWLQKIISAKTGCCTEAELSEGRCAGATRDNGNGRAVRNILESAMRAMSVRVVVEKKGTMAAATLLIDLDVATVAGEEIGVATRATCKAAHMAVPDLEKLTTGARILSLPNFDDGLKLARSDCGKITQLLESVVPKSHLPTTSAANIVITEPALVDVFADLDKMIGLASVKRAMREFYATVEFGKVRKRVGLKELKSQSFHMRFLGNPGTGKTVVARIVGRLLIALGAITKPKGATGDAVFNEVARSDLVAQYVGHTAPKVQKEVEKSMGGVFFLDEAYSLVSGARDQFGHEAVDTLIKEMEDKRANFVVICAGYEEEMDSFFDSNPGFKSRVPFSFYFEDYTCPQLAQIGRLSLKPKALSPPDDLTTYNHTIAFSTGCCEKLEDCPADKARGNGRAVRNLIEAAIRQMARRLYGSNAPKEAYSKLAEEDFSAVLAKSMETLFAVPCGPRGPLAKIISTAHADDENFQFLFQHLEKEMQGGRKEITTRLQRITSQIAVATQMRGLDPATNSHLQVCKTKQQDARNNLIQRMDFYCAPGGGLLDVAAEDLRTAKDKQLIEKSSALLQAAKFDFDAMKDLLRALIPKGETLQTAEDAIARCSEKLTELQQSDFRIPYDPFTSKQP